MDRLHGHAQRVITGGDTARVLFLAVTGLERRDLKVMGLASYQLLYTAMKIVSGRRRIRTSTVHRTCTVKHKSNQGLQHAPPRRFHPSIQESTSGIHHSYSGLSAILDFSHVGENVRSVLAANQYITDFLPFALYGTFVRLPQDRSFKEQPMKLAFGLSDSFILLVYGGEPPYLFSCLGTSRTYNLSVRTTIAFATIAVCGLDCVFTVSFLT